MFPSVFFPETTPRCDDQPYRVAWVYSRLAKLFPKYTNLADDCLILPSEGSLSKKHLYTERMGSVKSVESSA